MLSVSGVDREGAKPEEHDRVLRRDAAPAESVRAMRSWWDSQAPEYYQEHGGFLGDADFVWGPENLREATAQLLGAVSGRRGLEVGCGAAQCSRGLRGPGGAGGGVRPSGRR